MMLTIERWNSLTYSDRSVLLVEAGYAKNSYAGFPYTLLPNEVRHDLNYVVCRHHNRQMMPKVTRIVDEFREEFGEDVKVTYAQEGGLKYGHQFGFSLLELLLVLAMISGISAQILLTADLSQEAVTVFNSSECQEALKLVHQFPNLALTERYNELCS